MISLIEVLPVGNAIRLHLNPSGGATQWRLLRKLADDFTGQNDPAATVVLDSKIERVVLDRSSLANGTNYFYKLYSFVSPDWSASATVAAAPAMALEDTSEDVLELIRSRLDMGLQAVVQTGELVHEHNRIPVLNAPPAFEDARWPIVTVHMQADHPAEFGIGMQIDSDAYDPVEDEWEDHEGYLSSYQILVAVWSLNPDERITLRKTVKKLVLGNLPIFADAGLINVDASVNDTEDFTSYGTPVYQAVCTISCLAPSGIRSKVGAVDDITVSAKTPEDE